MKAAMLIANKTFRIVETTVPIPADDQVLVKIEYCGICRSDLWLWKNYEAKYSIAGFPGHEACGTIEKRGTKIKNFTVGDKVTVLQFPGKGYAEYMIADEKNCIQIPDVAKQKIVLGEPLACAMNILSRFTINSSDDIAVLGTGFMGCLLIKLLKAKGYKNIVGIDKRETAGSRAIDAGADLFFRDSEIEGIKKCLHDKGKRGFEIIIEASGTQQALDMATELMSNRGKLIIAGYHVGEKRTVDVQQWNWKGIDVINAHERDEVIKRSGLQEGMQMLMQHPALTDEVSHRFLPEEINEAFEMCDAQEEGFSKGIICFDK